jgi:putative oxidoreductase
VVAQHGARAVFRAAGALIMIGLLTRWAAFIASGEMAVAYFWMHAANGGLWWWDNRGEIVMLFSFTFLFFAASGAGPMSVDASLERRNEPRRA